jgi:phenylalanyl-tRNA synthetase beta chain
VDITNYVMLEYGQPLHSFDYARLRKKRIIVRRAKDGESFDTLDGTERQLSGDMLTIADGEGTVAIAGVMGGLNSEVTESTTSVLLEAASFKAASIHYTSRSLGLTSEASMRFERGISAGLTIPALRHATQLVAELGGGKAAPGIIDVYPGKKESNPITLTTEKASRVLGMDISQETILHTLTALGIACRADGSRITATAPDWRSDIRIEEDLIEEVARIIGYDKIPMTMLSVPIPRHDPEPILGLRKKIRQSLTGGGFQEIVTNSLVNRDLLKNLVPSARPAEPTPLAVVKPLTTDQECLRTSLRANLLTALAANQRHEEGGIRLFELGKIYVPRENDLPEEPDVLCGVMSGNRVERSWLGSDSALDFFDVKGVVEGLFGSLDIEISFANSGDAGLHPARQTAIVVKKEGKTANTGVIGELHPKVADAFELDGPVGLMEINVTELLPFAGDYKMFRPITRFPSTIRDIALVVDITISNQKVVNIIKSFPLISEVILFDVYSGKQVATGKKSLAYRLVYQSPEHTLTDAEVNKVQEKILAKLAKEIRATLRV